MLGRTQELNVQWQKFLDGLLLALALWLAHQLRLAVATLPPFEKTIPDFVHFRWLLLVIAPLGPFFLDLQGFYRLQITGKQSPALKQMARAAFWLGLAIAGCSYFLRLEVPSRAVMPLFAFLATGLLWIRYEFGIRMLRHQIRSEARREPVVLAGTVSDMAQFRKSLLPEELLALEVVTEFDLDKRPLSELTDILHQFAVSRVVFAGGQSPLHVLQQAIGACEVEGVEAWLAADFIRTAIARPVLDTFGSRPMLVFRTTPEISWALLVKGGIDRFGAAVGLLLLCPFLLLIAFAIKLSSRGPVLFRQQRGGKHGRPFTFYKFRSMVWNAEARQAELAPFNEMKGPVFKVSEDPRITPLGRFLRRSSLDELPQLWNVLRGEMSLVGPRPLPLYEIAQIHSSAQRRRLSMKPGLTCLWQIRGRNEIRSFEEWVRLDLEYIDHWSLSLDLKILLQTVPVVLRGAGAR
jgi:exopolysaccharide biosynthesis polyprenyl glycosylphosphotransferase